MTIIDDGMQEVPITADACSFDHRQALKLKDIEKRYEDQLKRRKKQWEKQLERMRGDFLQLFPVGQAHTSNDVDHPHQQPSGSGSGSGLSAKAHSSNESLVIKRKGSTDVLDPKKLRALMTEYPHEGRRFRLRFDLGGFDPKSVVVTVDHDRIIVRASRVVTVDDSTADEQQRLQQNPDTTTSTTAITTASTPTLARNGNGEQHHHLHLQPPPRSKKHIINQEQQQQLQSEAEHPEKRHPQQQQQDHAYQQEYVRKIERPAEVDPKRVRAFLSSDGVLTLEAQLPPQTLSLAGQHGAKSSPSHGGPVSLLHDSPSNSLAGRKSRSGSSDSPKTPSAAAPMKIGVPSFHERDGMRVLSLTIDLGATYKASEVMVQVVKENKLLVKARHEERTTERMVKSKFCREYELSEKIETYSVRAGLAEDNHLIVGALAKVNYTLQIGEIVLYSVPSVLFNTYYTSHVIFFNQLNKSNNKIIYEYQCCQNNVVVFCMY